jgi:hypothetical protein
LAYLPRPINAFPTPFRDFFLFLLPFNTHPSKVLIEEFSSPLKEGREYDEI